MFELFIKQDKFCGNVWDNGLWRCRKLKRWKILVKLYIFSTVFAFFFLTCQSTQANPGNALIFDNSLGMAFGFLYFTLSLMNLTVPFHRTTAPNARKSTTGVMWCQVLIICSLCRWEVSSLNSPFFVNETVDFLMLYQNRDYKL